MMKFIDQIIIINFPKYTCLTLFLNKTRLINCRRHAFWLVENGMTWIFYVKKTELHNNEIHLRCVIRNKWFLVLRAHVSDGGDKLRKI